MLYGATSALVVIYAYVVCFISFIVLFLTTRVMIRARSEFIGNQLCVFWNGRLQVACNCQAQDLGVLPTSHDPVRFEHDIMKI